MENRSHALLAGAFTLIFLTAAILIAIWVGRDRSELMNYEIVSLTSVGGLTAQSVVRYQGVPVGRVQGMALSAQRPGQVRIRIGVAPNTPITESTWAELGVQGVTGQVNVELRDDGSSSTLLRSKEGVLATIPLRPGFFDRFEQMGTSLMSGIEQTTMQLQRVLSSQNVEAFTATLQSTADITASLREASRNLAPVVGKMGPLMDSLNAASLQTGQAAKEVTSLVRDARQQLMGPDGTVVAATQSLNDIAWTASRLGNEALPAVTNMADTISAAARGASATLRRVGDSPQSLLFGPAPIAPGPGEPGFAGFGRQP